jgi:hypothetical protein
LKVFNCGAGKDGENQLKTYYIESRRKGTFYVQCNEGRPNGFFAYCGATCYLNMLLKER